MARSQKIETWQHWTLRIIVPAAAITAIVHEAWKSFPDWAVTPILFIAVFTIMVQNEQLLKMTESTAKKSEDLTTHSDKKLADIARQLADSADIACQIQDFLADQTIVRIHDTHAQFYGDLRVATELARNMVRTSYMRRFPPAGLGGEAEAYFDSCLKWARRDSAHRLRRVICRPDDNLLDWLRDQSGKSQTEGSHYLIRVVDWTVREADALSVAIVDDDLVFCAFSGSEDSMQGFSIRNQRLASYFIAYHNQLWNSGVEAGEFLFKRRMQKGRA